MKVIFPIIHEDFASEDFRFLDFVKIEDADKAQYILFMIPGNQKGLEYLHQHSWYKKYPNKCRILSGEDKPVRFLDGIFCADGFPYWQAEDVRFDSVISPEKRTYLASFFGGSTSILRKRIFNIQYPSDIAIRDTSDYHHWDPHQEGWRNQQLQYKNIVEDSWFIICPRGACHNSYRIYESMQSSRVPVIIDDKWTPSPGLPWDTFSIRIKESEIKKLPDILKSRIHEAGVMGKTARASWEMYIQRSKLGEYMTYCLSQLDPPRPISKRQQKLRLFKSELKLAFRKRARSFVLTLLRFTPLFKKLHINHR